MQTRGRWEGRRGAEGQGVRGRDGGMKERESRTSALYSAYYCLLVMLVSQELKVIMVRILGVF